MSNISRREREKEQRRRDIMDSAEKLFFEKGYDDVSMNDIAGDVELSKATLYLYFDNKVALFFAVVLRGTGIMLAMIQDEVRKFKTGIEQIHAFTDTYFKFAQNYPNYLELYNYFKSGRFHLESILTNAQMKEMVDDSSWVINFSAGFRPADISYASEVLKLQNEIFVTVLESIKTGLADGTVNSDVDPTEIAVLVIMITENIPNMRPDLKNSLKKKGIPQDKFLVDTKNLLNQMLGTPKSG
ncbi:TetR/AcrR family transcriptional regulator [Methanobacterium aggregans]|uniref:TetR/AcrR family transcriptional regulator n=1 Tax=Methanobacterium aggregans TaxID=1615586 RepID=UPI001AE76556|nr:TetR/AcrR family transcriptional regulator [Methanobacterium aggregans]MBP2046705.1 AcrR family transcriptional regulator [Methanobacterium aggregans]